MAWRSKRYLLLGLTYLGAVLVHGLWNGLSLLNSFVLLSQEFEIDASVPLSGLANLTPYILVAMAVTALAALLIINRRLARAASPPANLAEMPAHAQPDRSKYNPPESAGPERRADRGEINGEQRHNDGIDTIPD
jgi:hypothetical protein